MPVRHVVVFRFRGRGDRRAGGDHRGTAAPLPGRSPRSLSTRSGDDAGLVEGNPDFAVVADFDRRGDYVTYRDHPDHRA